MGNQKGNSSGIGTGSHTEDHRELFIKPNSKQKSRNKCIHYEFQSKFCKAQRADCVGPSNMLCTHYNENKWVKTSVEFCEPFKGIKLIDLTSITTGSKKFVTPTQNKIDKLVNFYDKYKKLDKPIIVSCKDGKYILEDKYLRYYVAKKLNLEKIHAIMNIPENQFILKLLKENRKVKHKIYGTGTIISIISDTIEIKFASTEKIIKFNIDKCATSNILTLL